MKILICQLRSHGDIIRTFPLIESLKSFYPGIFIGLTCLPEMLSTAELCSDLDQIIAQDKIKQPPKRIADCTPLIPALSTARAAGYDTYIDLHGIFQSACFGMLCEIPIRLGRPAEECKDGAQLFYNKTSYPHDVAMNRMERHFWVAQTLFPRAIPIKKRNDFLSSRTITLFPGSSRLGILKRWGTENYARIAEHFAQAHDVVVAIGPDETDLAHAFNHLSQQITIAWQPDWPTVSRLIAQSRFVVGNDSAAAHLAAWHGIPSFTIFGPTPHTINGIWRHGVGINFKGNSECRCADVWSGRCNKNHECYSGLDPYSICTAIENKISDLIKKTHNKI